MQKLHVGKATAGKILRGEIYDDESLSVGCVAVGRTTYNKIKELPDLQIFFCDRPGVIPQALIYQ